MRSHLYIDIVKSSVLNIAILYFTLKLIVVENSLYATNVLNMSHKSHNTVHTEMTSNQYVRHLLPYCLNANDMVH